MYKFQLTRLEFNDGTSIEPGEMTVFVGPNNVGKSRVLKDVLGHITRPDVSSVIVRSVGFTRPDCLADLGAAYDIAPYTKDGVNEGLALLNPTLCDCYSSGVSNQWNKWAADVIDEPDTALFRRIFGSVLITYLSTEHRLLLVKESASPSDPRQRMSLLQQLFYEGPKMELEVRRIFECAFEGNEIALDFSSPQRLLLRVGREFASIPPDPRLAGPFFEKTLKLDEQGDGMRAFAGIIVALSAVGRDVILVDEPEAFLHPPQAFRMGEILSEKSSGSRQLIIATHSVDVLRGILSRNPRNVSIIRIDRVDDVNSFRRLDSDRLHELVTDPLLSSARVLDGIFYSGSVVVEADADARFFQAASRKMAKNLDLHFVNADNKQTVPKILRIYNELGVRCAGIVDIDVINDASEFKKQLSDLSLITSELSEAMRLREDIAAGISKVAPSERLSGIRDHLSRIGEMAGPYNADGRPLSETEARSRVQQIERRLREIIENGRPWRELKQRGREALSAESQNFFDSLAGICATHGLFVIPCGELESMLVEHGIQSTTDKKGWIVQALKVLASLEVSHAKHPFKFLKAVHEYLTGMSGGNTNKEFRN